MIIWQPWPRTFTGTFKQSNLQSDATSMPNAYLEDVPEERCMFHLTTNACTCSLLAPTERMYIQYRNELEPLVSVTQGWWNRADVFLPKALGTILIYLASWTPGDFKSPENLSVCAKTLQPGSWLNRIFQKDNDSNRGVDLHTDGRDMSVPIFWEGRI